MAKPNEPEKPEPSGFLGDLDAKLAALQALRDSYVRAVAVGAIGGAVDFGSMTAPLGTVRNDQPTELPTGAFLNKSIPEAIKLLFVATKRKYSSAEVAVALREGGLESTAKNYEKIIRNTVWRMKEQGILLKFKDGFGLAELYPEHLRAKLSETSKPAKPVKNAKKAAKGARKTAPKTKTAKAAVKATAPKPATGTTVSLDTEILAVLESEGPTSPSALVERFGKPSNVIGLALGRMAKLGKAEKLTNGHYAIAGTSPREPVLRAV